MNPIAQEYYAKSVGVVRLTWEDVEHDTLKIIDRMKQDGFEPDIIVSIARSGLIPASLIAYALGNKQLYVIKVDFSKVQKAGRIRNYTTGRLLLRSSRSIFRGKRFWWWMKWPCPVPL